MESKQIKQFSLCIVFEKTNEDIFKKMQNALFAKIWEKMNFPQKSKFGIFSIYSPPNFMQKIRKN